MDKMVAEIDVIGKSGEDLYVKVPRGTVVRDLETGKLIADLSKEGQVELILPGGRGGKGNSHFATSTRQAPSIIPGISAITKLSPYSVFTTPKFGSSVVKW